MIPVHPTEPMQPGNPLQSEYFWNTAVPANSVRSVKLNKPVQQVKPVKEVPLVQPSRQVRPVELVDPY